MGEFEDRRQRNRRSRRGRRRAPRWCVGKDGSQFLSFVLPKPSIATANLPYSFDGARRRGRQDRDQGALSDERSRPVSEYRAICETAIGHRPGRRRCGGCCSAAARSNAPQDTFQAGGRERPEDPEPAAGRCSSSPASSASSSSRVIIYVVIRFRDRGQEMPKQTHGKPALEIALTIIPAVILIGRRHPHGQHGVLAGQDQRHAVRHQRHRPAVVVGVRVSGAELRRRARSPSRSSPAASW